VRKPMRWQRNPAVFISSRFRPLVPSVLEEAIFGRLAHVKPLAEVMMEYEQATLYSSRWGLLKAFVDLADQWDHSVALFIETSRGPARSQYQMQVMAHQQ